MLRQDLRLTCESTLGELLRPRGPTGPKEHDGDLRLDDPRLLCLPRPRRVLHTRSYELRVNMLRTRDQEIEEFVQHTDYLRLTSEIWVNNWYKILNIGPFHSVV